MTSLYGPCTIPRPCSTNVIECAKWNVWKTLNGLEKNEAMLAFIQALTQYEPDWENHIITSDTLQDSSNTVLVFEERKENNNYH